MCSVRRPWPSAFCRSPSHRGSCGQRAWLRDSRREDRHRARRDHRSGHGRHPQWRRRVGDRWRQEPGRRRRDRRQGSGCLSGSRRSQQHRRPGPATAGGAEGPRNARGERALAPAAARARGPFRRRFPSARISRSRQARRHRRDERARRPEGRRHQRRERVHRRRAAGDRSAGTGALRSIRAAR